MFTLAQVVPWAIRQGSTVVSCDPIYRFAVEELRNRIADTYDEILEQTRRNVDEFVWESIRSVDELGRVRMGAMNEFLDDDVAAKPKDDTSTPNCRTSRSTTPPMTSRSARIFAFCTARSSAARSIGRQSGRCAASHTKSACFLCRRSAGRHRHGAGRWLTI